MKLLTVLDALCGAPGLSGNERGASDMAKRLFEPYCDETEIDGFGNVTATRFGKAEGLAVMLSSHIDEVGFVVAGITEGGFLNVRNLGGIDPKILPSTDVIVHTESGRLPGVVAVPPKCLPAKDGQSRAAAVDELLVDIGYSRERAERLVAIGTAISYKCVAWPLGDRCVTSKTLDNRIHVAAMLECAKQLRAKELTNTLHFVSNSREETGAHGAYVAAKRLKPDLAIVFDVGQAATPDAGDPELMAIGRGPYITFGPQLHPVLSRRLRMIATKLGFSFQTAISSGWTSTDASIIQVAGRGVPCVLVGIPLRYMHTPVETIHTGDYDNLVRLIVEFLLHLEENREELYAEAPL